MSEETLENVYEELKELRDQIGLKLHLGGMELRDQWNELDGEWSSWTHQLEQELDAKSEEIEHRIREAGGEDLRKIEIKTELAISKLRRGFKEVAEKLAEND